MIQSIENIALTGVNAQNTSVDVTDGSVMAYRVSIDTSSKITGNKTIAFTGVASESLTVINFIIEGGINTSGASKLIIGGVTIPDLFALKKSIVFFEYVNSAWVVHYSISAEQPGIIDGDSILDGTIPADKLENDIAGSGMTRDGKGGVIPNLEAVQPSLQVVADELGVKIDPSRAVTKDSNGLGVNLESSDPSLQISANELGVKIAVDGGLEKTANGMAVKLDGGDLVKTSSGLKLGNCMCVKQVALTLTVAQIGSLNSTPIELLPALGATIYTMPISAYARKRSGITPWGTYTTLNIFGNGLSDCFQLDCLGSSANYLEVMENVGGAFNLNEPVLIGAVDGDPVGGNTEWEVIMNYLEYDTSI